ncbi:MAG: T9SS type A sorting domain-containing protein [Bacteroidia bacterium]
MKPTLLLLSFGLFFSFLPAQQTFIRAYGDQPFSSSSVFIPNDLVELPTREIFMVAFPGFILKTDTAGKPLWVKRIAKSGATITSTSYPRLAAFTDNNEYYIAGQISADTAFVMKTDSSGALIWAKNFSEKSLYPYCMTTTSDGGVVVGSVFEKPNLSRDPIVIKLDNSGNVEWQKKYENVLGSNSAMSFYEVTTDNSGELIFCGVTNTGTSGFYGPVVVKTSSAGEVLWAKLAGTAVQGNAARKVAILNNGNIRVMINRPETATLFGYMDLDSQGNAISGNAYTATATSECRFEINPVGEMLINIENSAEGIRLAANGSVKFAYTYLQTAISPAFFSQIKPMFNADGSCTFLGAYTYSFFGDWAGVLAKTSAIGETSPGYFSPFTINLVPFPGGSASTTTTVTHTAINNEIAVNLVINDVPAFYDSLFTTFTALDPEKMFDFSVYPNPAGESVVVETEVFATEKSEIFLLDVSGKVVFHDKVFSPEYTIPLSHLPSGIYFIKAICGEKLGFQKLVIRH